MILTVIFGAALILPVLYTLATKTNASVMFLALCAGSMLEKLTGEDARLITSSVTSGNLIAQYAVRIAIVVLPAILMALFLRKTVTAGKIVFHIVPAIATGAVGVILVVGLLSQAAQATAMDNNIWKILKQYEEFILLLGVASSLLVAGISSRHKDEHGKKHHDK